ncbi:MAG: beta-N-acetylhexosaminidase [bacterium]|nr:beta-N-acetylhexosaminidase [bacterium]
MSKNYADLSADALASRLIMIDIPAPQLSEHDRQHLSVHPWNGVILFAKNVTSAPQVRALIRSLHSCLPVSPLIAIDQEGGIVNRFRFPEMSLSPGLLALGHSGSEEDVYSAHRIMGRELRNLGIHLDFAPCLDVNNNPSNPIIGVRSFGEDPQLVARLGRQAIRGLRDGGVAPTAKHFPGHGNTSRDSHLALPIINSNLEELENTELIPFQAAVEEGVEAIMTAHIVFPALDPQVPATLSAPILCGLLREKMGYQGLIVTDSLSMRSIADRWGFGEATVRSIEAGADLILALGSFEQQDEARQTLAAAISSGRISRERIYASLKRIENLQERYHGLPQDAPDWDIAEHKNTMQAITSRTVSILRNEDHQLPLQLKPQEKLLIIAPDMLPQSPLGEMEKSSSWADLVRPYWGNSSELTFDLATSGPALGELGKQAAAADCVLLLLYARGRISDSQIDIAKEVLAANQRTVLIPLSSPYILADLPPVRQAITAYNYGEMSLQALFSQLFSPSCADAEANASAD